MLGISNFMKTLVALASVLVLLTGCVSTDYTVGTPPTSDPSAYQPVEFSKLASGAFTAELNNKLVSLRCRFTQAYSLDGRTLQGQVAAPEGHAAGALGVQFPDALREKAVGLKVGDILTLRGKVRAVVTTSARGASWSGNYLEVYFIDP